ncbi:substrate-binding periplasmic protein [Aquipseudomonas guryensis]|uniref:Transporter substrate-binding domain-containing protein n=1 Tax=Aquipseudomonas guryensis TaxID=2759165 RepID=A0A7W4H1M7_9GAMM|nr:transporter substrate-binding domain-containing protein [Pseudomonas guryensis]MBB1517706.1 transporter substrate-binding domain-containing protein [Pseudomonas guryensis]
MIYLLGWLGFAAPAAAATFEVGFYDYPPMMIERDNSGIYQDIFDELSLLLGDKFNVRYYPYPRIGLLFNGGQLDIEPGVYAGWVKGQEVPGEFSVPFGKIVDVMVFAPGKAFAVNTPDDLRGKALGLVRGYAYPDLRALIEAGQIDRRNALNELQLLEMLASARFDQIVINKAVAQYNIRQVPAYRTLEVGDAISVFDVSMRVHPRNKVWLERLDEAIVKLKRDGVIERIYAKYGVRL